MKTWVKVSAATVGIIAVDDLISQIYNDTESNVKYSEARAYCTSVGKQLLNVGCGNNPRFIGDVNLDSVPCILPNFIQHDLNTVLPFTDKQFGAVIDFHVLEHVNDPQFVLSELNRVADRVYVVVPQPYQLLSWINPDHQWMFVYGHVYSTMPVKAALVLGLGVGIVWLVSKKRKKKHE